MSGVVDPPGDTLGIRGMHLFSFSPETALRNRFQIPILQLWRRKFCEFGPLPKVLTPDSSPVAWCGVFIPPMSLPLSLAQTPCKQGPVDEVACGGESGCAPESWRAWAAGILLQGCPALLSRPRPQGRGLDTCFEFSIPGSKLLDGKCCCFLSKLILIPELLWRNRRRLYGRHGCG